jgi:hypothetical protein
MKFVLALIFCALLAEALLAQQVGNWINHELIDPINAALQQGGLR